VNSTQAFATLYCPSGQNYVNYFLIVCDAYGVFVDYGHVGLSGCVCKIATQQILKLPGLNKLTSIILNIVFTM